MLGGPAVGNLSGEMVDGLGGLVVDNLAEASTT